MTFGDKNQNYRRSNRDQFKRSGMRKKTRKTEPEKNHVPDGTFGEGHLKTFPAMGKTCKSCSRPNHFAKLCRPNQVNEIAEENSSSEEECNLIHSFDSCEEFEIKAIESKVQNSHGKVENITRNERR